MPLGRKQVTGQTLLMLSLTARLLRKVLSRRSVLPKPFSNSLVATINSHRPLATPSLTAFYSPTWTRPHSIHRTKPRAKAEIPTISWPISGISLFSYLPSTNVQQDLRRLSISTLPSTTRYATNSKTTISFSLVTATKRITTAMGIVKDIRGNVPTLFVYGNTTLSWTGRRVT